MTPDQRIARDQWQAQRAVMKASERRIQKALTRCYLAGVTRWQSTGDVAIPREDQVALGAQMVRMWRDSLRVGMRMAVVQDEKAFPGIETKDFMSIFDRLVFDFISRFAGLKIVQIIETTRDQIRRAIERGARAGLGQEGIAKQIAEAAPNIAKARARVIARTEVHTAAIQAAQQVADDAIEPMNKRWISTFDHRTRDFGEVDGKADMANHRVMNEVTVGPGEMFSVPRKTGGHDLMTGPGDPNAPPYQVINCRCALLFRRVGRPWPKRG